MLTQLRRSYVCVCHLASKSKEKQNYLGIIPNYYMDVVYMLL